MGKVQSLSEIIAQIYKQVDTAQGTVKDIYNVLYKEESETVENKINESLSLIEVLEIIKDKMYEIYGDLCACKARIGSFISVPTTSLNFTEIKDEDVTTEINVEDFISPEGANDKEVSESTEKSSDVEFVPVRRKHK